MIEIVLVSPAIACLDNIKSRKLGNNQLKEPGTLHIDKPLAGMFGHHYLVELVNDALTTDNLYSASIAHKGVKSLIVNEEVQLCGEAYATHHAQWIVRECYVGVKWRADNAVPQVINTAEGVYELAKAGLVKAYRHSVDGKIAAVLVIFQGAILNHRLAAVVAIALLTGSDELHLMVLVLYLSSTEIAENRQMSFPSKHLLKL